MRRTPDHYGAPPVPPVDFGLFAPDPQREAAHLSAVIALTTPSRKQKAAQLRDAKWARWIEAGKPIALMVAKKDGKVTAATFRVAAESLNALPPSYDNQRALAWIPAMFADLCAEGLLEKARREDGSVVKVYCPTNGNEQTVYRLRAA